MLDLLMGAGDGEPGGTWTVVASVSWDNYDPDLYFPFPDGFQPGDAVFAYYSRDGALDLSDVPDGWQLIGQQANATLIFLPSITDQTDVTMSGAFLQYNVNVQIVVLRPTGVNVVDHILDVSVATGSSGLPDPPALTTTTDHNYILLFAHTSMNSMIYMGVPSGFTEVVKSGSSTYNSSITAISSEPQALAGVVDPGAFSGPNGGNWTAFTVSLRAKPKSGVMTLSGSFASGVADLPAGGEVVASATTVTVNVEAGGSVPISISGGNVAQYRVNGGAWTSAAGTVSNGAVVEIRQTAPATAYGTRTTVTATLSVGDKSASYSLTGRREMVLSPWDGTVYWTVPVGVSSLNVVGTGGGGGGGDRAVSSPNYYGGGGGGGGGMSITPSLAVSAGQVLTLVAGWGGDNPNGGAGSPGGDSTIVRSGTTLWRAKGGNGGSVASGTTPGSGGSGGSATNGIGTTRYSGGRGGNGTSGASSAYYNGGGGGAGGYSGNGGIGANGSSSTTRNVGGNGAGGAGAGGGSDYGGGGTGVSGAGASGTGDASGGAEGSPDSYAGSGGSLSGGESGGGGPGAGRGEYGLIRIIW